MKSVLKISFVFLTKLIFIVSLLSGIQILGIEERNKNAISVDYLESIPDNDYILGPGDKLEVIVSRDYPELDSNDAIDMAGGSKVLKGKTRFVRFLNHGQIDTCIFKYSKKNKKGTYENPYLNESDLIIIDDGIDFC